MGRAITILLAGFIMILSDYRSNMRDLATISAAGAYDVIQKNRQNSLQKAAPVLPLQSLRLSLGGEMNFSMLRLQEVLQISEGIKHANELQGGFPVSQEELFQYEALIFGDIEASYFTIDQLEMVERFVRDRGGGFLMLGVKNSFSEGDYWNTPIANILPVVLDPSRKQIIMPDYSGTGETDDNAGFNFVPTRSGYDHPILKLVQDIGNNRALWNEMNKLTHINLYGGVKPRAVTLAEKKKDGESTEPLLVIQRYGKGQAATLAWRWQLQRNADDMSHERFWRQLVQ